MPSFSVQSWVDYSLCLAHSFFLCSLRNQQLLMLVCRGFVSWHSAMHSAVFMDGSIAASRGIGKSIPPTIIVILGSCVFRIVWIYTVFAHFQTISSLYLFVYLLMGELQDLQKLCFFVVSFNIIYSKNSPSSIGGR